MRTRRRIAAILGSAFLASAAAALAAVVALGMAGLFLVAVAATAAWTTYVRLLAPWHRRWGATTGEVQGPLPGDDLVPDGAATTRAITIAAPPAQVWPWLVQIGFGRAGWYSYDWIDNDGRPSATRVLRDLQGLAVGDRIPMTPDLGFVVVALDRRRPWSR